MASPRQENLSEPYNFYREYYQGFLIILIIMIVIMLTLAGVVLYQVTHKPQPLFYAVAPNNNQLALVSHDGPNLRPETLSQWASKAAVAAYTYDFANYNKQLAAARPYFTPAGWESYQSSISGLIQSVIKNQVFVNGVVIGAPVITAQGDFTGQGYAWRIQLPFLVSTLTAEVPDIKKYTVILTIVKVPTNINPAGIGVDQFVMVGS